VVNSARDADLAAVLGLGFPGFRGGPCHTIDSIGADKVVRQLRSLRDLFGERFEPAALLVDIDSGRLRG
jgi:3-hydroxyacyl-CoA dehydrogenase